ncbi:MAG: thiol-disulfide oxidoreductase DCC family protein [Acidimicrobiales bacterium]
MVDATYLVYDGDCGFCQRCAEWCADQWGTDVIVVRGTDFLGQSNRLSPQEVASSVWWVEPGASYRGAAAVARALAATTSPWRVLGRIAMRGPLPWLGEPLYRLVARFRHRLPGALACRRPSR